jgi:hypothetical protein
MKLILRAKGATLTPKERKILKMATHFYASRLMSDRLSNTLEININVIKDFYVKNKILGEAFPKDDVLGIPSNKQFVINLEWNNKLGKRVLQCLAHEMVHVKQYAKGELKFHERGNLVTFQREQYQGDEYWESLWEIEAYGREVGLYQKFRPTLKLLKKEI